MLTIVDYGVGNLASIKNMLKKIGADAQISSDPSVISAAEKLILPGVGAFDTCAQKLQESGLTGLLNQKALVEKIPVLGICVGMQLLMSGSEEGILPGLGWINGKIIRFRQDQLPSELKIPHMGWNTLNVSREHKLLESLPLGPQGLHAYFVHSFHFVPNERSSIVAETDYGGPVTAFIAKDNMAGTQFHPEKSQTLGLKLIANFLKWAP